MDQTADQIREDIALSRQRMADTLERIRRHGIRERARDRADSAIRDLGKDLAGPLVVMIAAAAGVVAGIATNRDPASEEGLEEGTPDES
jgi:hypothetical protein